MKRQFQMLIGAVLLFGSATAFAYIYEGSYNWRGETFYVNGRGAYCQQQNYDPYARQLSSREYRELSQMRYDGPCTGYLKGAVNYRGRSYYANGVDAYCQYPYYHNDFRELGSTEARQMFRLRFDGTCR